MTRQTLWATTALVAFASPLAAQDAFELDEIFVSGALTPTDTTRLGRAVTVVTAEEIATRGLTSVQEVLRALPGVSVSSAGSSLTQVRMRGGEANHVLVLIDGVQAAGGDGEYTFSALETANIERVEVLRGPQSVAFGSGASAGVINIITRNSTGGSRAEVAASVGNGYEVSIFAAERGEQGGLSFGAVRSVDNGYDYSGDGGEKDYTNRLTYTFDADYQVTDSLTLEFSLRNSTEDYALDGSNGSATSAEEYVVDDPDTTARRTELLARLAARLDMMDGRMTHELAYEYTENERDLGFFATLTEATVLDYQMDFALDGLDTDSADQLATLYISAESDRSSSNPDYGRDTVSYAVEYKGSYANGLDVQAGMRFDDNTQFADSTVWNTALAYTFASGIRLHGSAGTGVVYPSYFELYDNYFPSFTPGTSNSQYNGNPDLTPERNRSFDIGIEIPVMGGAGLVDITYFNEVLQDEIQTEFVSYDGDTDTEIYTFSNQEGESTREGVEIAGELAASDRLDLRLSYTYLDARNPDGSVEIRRPKHELSLGATLDTFNGRGDVSADLRHVSGNFDTQFWGSYETLELPAITTVDIAARYDLTDTVSLDAQVTNLFDNTNSDTWGFANRGREMSVGLKARF